MGCILRMGERKSSVVSYEIAKQEELWGGW